MQTSFIFITGGVLSSLGKGLTLASIALLLESRGLKVAVVKFDPYLNVDPGTMSPFQHGEVFVTDDGAETDLDLGHYHRFTNAKISKLSNITSGQIYEKVIKKERQGDYLGQTVQVIPHVTDAILDHLRQVATQEPGISVVLVEIGGTVGDIESLPFLEAIRQFRLKHPKNTLNIHLTYIPFIKTAGELKTKPTQHSVQTLRQIGIIPDLIICRSENPISEDIRSKISLFCSLPTDAIFDAPDVDTIYRLPLLFAEQAIDRYLLEKLNLEAPQSNLTYWQAMVDRVLHPKKTLSIAIVGKYIQHQDAYKSVFEALEHAATEQSIKIIRILIEAEEIDSPEKASELLSDFDGVIVPGGFGSRGIMGILYTAAFCRTAGMPYFGICLGMQMLCVEFAQNVLEKKEAHSTEIAPFTKEPLFDLLKNQLPNIGLGGTMRLGAYPCKLKKGSKASCIYNQEIISERHRHRYEFNSNYIEEFEKNGLMISGIYTQAPLVEIVEYLHHPWMMGVQFHPEFSSKPMAPHPLFTSFVEASLQYRMKK